jgi:ABC-2 type transport system ATP-binding protein
MAATADDAVRFDGLEKRYGTTDALDGFTARVPRGSITAMLGRNGAGKSTAIRCALGLLHPDAGRVRLLGEDSRRIRSATRARIGYASSTMALDPRASIDELEDLGAALYPTWDRALSLELRERLALAGTRRISELSTGQARKAALWFNLAFRPELLILDEPAGNLDAIVRREFLEALLAMMRDEGLTVLMATHLLTDVERVADRVIVIEAGRTRLESGLDDLKDRVKAIRVPRDRFDVAALPTGSRLLATRCFGDDELLTIDGCDAEVSRALAQATGGATEVIDLSLEDIFIALGQADVEIVAARRTS